ncbi:MAG: hypothetical protein R3D29_15670 [Nitratireductor sp.]
MRHLFGLKTNDLLAANTIALTPSIKVLSGILYLPRLSSFYSRFALYRDIPEFEQAPAECRQFHPDGMLHSIWQIADQGCGWLQGETAFPHQSARPACFARLSGLDAVAQVRAVPGRKRVCHRCFRNLERPCDLERSASIADPGQMVEDTEMGNQKPGGSSTSMMALPSPN